MGANVWPVNAVSGAPSYTGRVLRQTTVAPFTAMGSAARPLGAKSGVRLGTPASIVSVTSTAWTVQPCAGILDGESAAVAGPYGYSFDTAQTGTVTAAGSQARKDRLDVQVSDPAESDGSSTPTVKIIYTQGAATGGAVPAAPARSHALCVINVPATGGGSPTISWAPEWSGDPGEWTFNTYAELTAYTTLITAANVPVNQRATVIADTTTSNNGDYVWSGSAWVPAKPGLVLLAAKSVSAAGSVSFDGVCTALFDNYLIEYNLVMSGNSNVQVRFRVAGADASSALYNTIYQNWNGAGATFGYNNNGTIGSLTGTVNAGGTLSGRAELFSPALAQKTRLKYDCMISDAGQAASQGTCEYQATTVFDGFTLIAAAGTMTGTVRVYGYAN